VRGVSILDNEMSHWRDKANSLKDVARSAGIQKLVAGSVIVKQGCVLLLRRQKGDFLEGLYELPSGGTKPGESIIDALLRETLEETGLTILRISGFLNSFDYASKTGRRTRQFNFIVEAKGNVVLDPEEHSEAVRITPGQVDSLKGEISEETMAVLRKVGSMS
jgi:8-oxo-dGTP diphosphatase